MYESLKVIIDFFVDPFLELIKDLGLENKIIKIGFGNVEWINFELYDLVNLILSGLVIYLFLLIIYKLLKKLANVITGGVLK